MKIILTTLFLTLCSLSFSQSNEKNKVLLQDQRIQKTLEELLLKETPNAAVIFEEPSTQKFIQFAGSKTEELLFDFPSSQLSAAEFEKATTILKEYQIEHHAGTFSTFSKPIEKNIDLAIELISKIMIEVLGTDEDVKLTIQTID
ncbi:hypothetical protein [Maribacter sp. 2210JD10-5]|uniref:hypothetical protein n=1 Tax=Maribacter sp. 2210JD10-5 TaxID=3386272 RepID=UPI0039BCB135